MRICKPWIFGRPNPEGSVNPAMPNPEGSGFWAQQPASEGWHPQNRNDRVVSKQSALPWPVHTSTPDKSSATPQASRIRNRPDSGCRCE